MVMLRRMRMGMTMLKIWWRSRSGMMMLKRREIMMLSMMMVTRMMKRTMVLRNVVELQRWLREMM